MTFKYPNTQSLNANRAGPEPGLSAGAAGRLQPEAKSRTSPTVRKQFNQKVHPRKRDSYHQPAGTASSLAFVGTQTQLLHRLLERQGFVPDCAGNKYTDTM